MAPKLIESAAYHHNAGNWWLRLFLVMPDHVHALLAVAPDRRISTIVSAWKSYQSKRLRVKWQSGFFDHRIRSNESLDEKAEYIWQNPVRAGLVTDAKEWPYVRTSGGR